MWSDLWQTNNCWHWNLPGIKAPNTIRRPQLRFYRKVVPVAFSKVEENALPSISKKYFCFRLKKKRKKYSQEAWIGLTLWFCASLERCPSRPIKKLKWAESNTSSPVLLCFKSASDISKVCYKSCEEQLREVGLFSLKKMRLREILSPSTASWKETLLRWGLVSSLR